MGHVDLLHRELSRRVIGVFFDVYNELGVGLLESAYRRAMAIALGDAGIAVEEEVAVEAHFRGRSLGVYRIDLLVDRTLILECKTADTIAGHHEAQLVHYLRITDIQLGLLLLFGNKPQFRRMVRQSINSRSHERPDQALEHPRS